MTNDQQNPKITNPNKIPSNLGLYWSLELVIWDFKKPLAICERFFVLLPASS